MSALFYHHKTNGDVLFLVIEPEAYPDKVVAHGDVIALYKEDRLVGVNFRDIGKVVKIHASGLLLPVDDRLVDVLNALLGNAGLSPLPYFRSSGYRVAEVKRIEEHPLDESKRILTLACGEQTLNTVTRYRNFGLGDHLVVATDGTIRFDGTRFRSRVERNIPIEAEVCSPLDLRAGEEGTLAYLAPERKPGSDFYIG